MTLIKTCKQQLTKAVNHLKNITPEATTLLEKLQIERLENNERIRLNKLSSELKGKYDVIQKYDKEWTAQLTDQEEYDKYNEEQGDYMEMADNALILHDQIEMEKATGSNYSTKLDENAKNGGSVIGAPSTIVQRIEEMKLPEFHGDPCEWRVFSDLCKAILEQSTYTPIQRWIKLTSYVKGEAAKEIKGLTASEDSYKNAMEILEDQYGRMDTMKRDLMRQWEKLPKAKTVDDAKELLTHTRILVRQFKSAGLQIEDPMYTYQLSQRFPHWMMKKIWNKNQEPTLDQLTQEADNIIRQEKFASGGQESKENSSSPKRSFQPIHNSSIPKHCGNSTSTGSQKSNVPQSPCYFCGGIHWSRDCSNYPTAQTKLQRAKQLRLCERCMKPGHKTNECQSNKCCYNCKQAHNSLLCMSSQQSKTLGTGSNAHPVNSNPRNATRTYESNQKRTVCVAIEKEEVIGVSSEQTLHMGKEIMIQAVKNPKKSSLANVIFDSGSNLTLIRKELAEKLNLAINFMDKAIKTVGIENSSKTIGNTTLEVRLINGNTLQVNAQVMEEICSPILTARNVPEEINEIKKWKVEKNLHPTKPDILIGIGNYWDFEIVDTKERMKNGLTIANSLVGPMISGKFETKSGIPYQASITLAGMTAEDDETLKLLQTMYSLENLGIKEEEENVDKKVLQQFKESIKMADGRYQVRLPWKEEEIDIQNNFSLSLNRLKSVCKKLESKPDLLKAYSENIDYMKENEIIEKVPFEERIPSDDRPVHYIPHLPVIKESSQTTKLRVVFDGSAKAGKTSKSLNSQLQRGPVILPNLLGVLLRIRSYKYVVSSDVAKAFLQVSLDPVDRDVTRFLWLKDSTKPTVEGNLAVYRFCRVTFGLKPSPFLLAGTLQVHFSKYESNTARELEENLYVDNAFFGVNNEQELQEKCSEAIKIFDEAAMNLRQFVSNHPKMHHVVDKERLARDTNHKLLGINWEPKTDELNFKLPAAIQGPLTKRRILESIASFYDPLGLLSPVLLEAKIFLQNLWKKKLDWDEKLNEDKVSEWNSITTKINGQIIQIPRFTGPPNENPTSLELHAFADASGKGYGAAVYARYESNGQIVTSLLASKNRLTNTRFSNVEELPEEKRGKKITELELLAVLTAVKLLESVKNEIHQKVERTIIWTDSKDVLYWILNGCKEKNIFVTNRLKQIQQHSNKLFKHVPTKQNPADILSRGMEAKQLSKNELWWKGPTFMKQSEENWPKLLDVDLDTIKRKEDSQAFHCMIITKMEENPQTPIIDISKWSSWTKIIKAVRGAMQYREILQAKCQSRERVNISFQQARNFLIKESQRINPPNKSELKQMNIHKDEFGILRCHSRLENSKWSAETVHPIYLNRESQLCKLIILDYHENCQHAGVTITLTNLRQKFWITQGRRTTLSILRKNCMKCKPFFAKPFAIPKFPPLPSSRVQQEPPFTNTGTDLFGPYTVKQGTRTIKVYGIVFTCMVTRAVHFEIVESLTGEDYIEKFEQFVARRGLPQRVWSDNGTNLELAAKVLKSRYSPTHKFEWNHITPIAPWRGGFYERLIKIAKDSLKRTMGRTHMQYSSFQTLLSQVEATLNSRPLTRNPEILESLTIIRPVDFLRPDGTVNDEVPSTYDSDTAKDPTYMPKFDNKIKLIDLWENRRQRLDKFWEIWHELYLTMLRDQKIKDEKSKNFVKRDPEIGEAILIELEEVERGKWPLGVIKKLIRGKDGVVRTVELKMLNGKTLLRAINKIYPLELDFQQPEATDLILLISDPTNNIYEDDSMESPLEEEKMDIDQETNEEGSDQKLETIVHAEEAGRINADDSTTGNILINRESQKGIEPHAECSNHIDHLRCRILKVKDLTSIRSKFEEEPINNLAAVTLILWALSFYRNDDEQVQKELGKVLAWSTERAVESLSFKTDQGLRVKDWIQKHHIHDAIYIWKKYCKIAEKTLFEAKWKTISSEKVDLFLIDKPTYHLFASQANIIKNKMFHRDKREISVKKILLASKESKWLTSKVKNVLTIQTLRLRNVIKTFESYYFTKSSQTIIILLDDGLLDDLSLNEVKEIILTLQEKLNFYEHLSVIWLNCVSYKFKNFDYRLMKSSILETLIHQDYYKPTKIKWVEGIVDSPLTVRQIQTLTS